MSTSERDKAEIAAAKQHMAAAGVHTVIAQFVDIHGAVKATYIPIAHLDDIVSPGAGFGSPSINGTGLPRHGPRAEFYGQGDLATLQAMPWMPGYARIACDGVVLDEPYSRCSRHLLKRQMVRLAERGWTLNVGIEPEFCLFHQDAAGRPIPADVADTLDKPSYDFKAMARVRDVLRRQEQGLDACGFDMFQIDHEDAADSTNSTTITATR